MKYLSFIRPDNQASIGRLENDSIIELLEQGGSFTTLKKVLSSGSLSQLQEGAIYKPDEITFLPPIPDPDKVICIGLNYGNHIAETGREPGATYPVIFTRFADTLVAHKQGIVRPVQSEKLDYEGELAVIIGKTARHVSEADAADYIAGYSCFNDASVRDWQRHSSHFTAGKNFPATGGFGPYLVTTQEIPVLGQQHVCTRLNDELLQDQPLSDLIFSVPALIAYISAFTTLRPGDVIATGTPGGVGYARKPPLWMQAGDTVRVSIDQIGTLENPIIAE